MAKVIIGSRGSKLALTQSRQVADALRGFHPSLTVEIVEIKTSGDRNLGASLSELGGKGAFTKELEDALLDRRCDIAVHSLKDLPTTLPDGLRVLCTPGREDTRDVLVCRKDAALDSLPQGAIVGTSSLRRRALLANMRPDLHAIEFRGNVDTRLQKLRDGKADACILAAAGLKRLALLDEVEMRVAEFRAHWLDWLPAPGQGALGIEGRDGDVATARLLAPLHDAATFAATVAERAFLNELGAGCQAPVGALATCPEGSRLHLTGCVLSKDGARKVEGIEHGLINEPETTGRALAQELIRLGANVSG
ncbi:MAG: hydroxymethylbilane synthase [Planctomycetes bacterium]|nr:hydroxymethylbilane synthase [Planctomycetota bacterium]MCW8134630.1 hydroxymethylbilane synthase [Planctomycetota bacterium]